MKVLGLAPRGGLQNVSCCNWPSSPEGRNHFSFCYLERIPEEATVEAKKLGEVIRVEKLYTDDDRYILCAVDWA